MGLILVTVYIYTHIPGCLSLGTTGILGPVTLCRWNLSFALQGTQLCIWFLLTGFCDHCPLSCDNQECLQRLSNVSWEAEDYGFIASGTKVFQYPNNCYIHALIPRVLNCHLPQRAQQIFDKWMNDLCIQSTHGESPFRKG